MHKPYNLARDPIFFLTAAFFALITTVLPTALGQPRFLPINQALALSIFNLIALRNKAPRSALIVTGSWLVIQSLTVAALTWFFPGSALNSLADGFNLRAQTLEWAFADAALPGSLADSPVARIIELLGIIVGSLVTAGFLGFWFLVRATNLAAFNAGILLDAIPDPAVLFLAWPIWTILRLIGYAGMLVVLAQPLATGEWSPTYYWLRHRKLILGSVLCVLLGFLLEFLLSDLWAQALRNLL